MALYDWPMNQYKVPNYGLLYDNVNPYADSMGLMSGAYSPWDTPAVDSNYTGDPWFKGPDVTWGSPDQEYADYMQGLVDDEAAAIRNANNINNPYYDGSDGEAATDMSTGNNLIGDYINAMAAKGKSLGYGIQDILAQAQDLDAYGGVAADASGGTVGDQSMGGGGHPDAGW